MTDVPPVADLKGSWRATQRTKYLGMKSAGKRLTPNSILGNKCLNFRLAARWRWSGNQKTAVGVLGRMALNSGNSSGTPPPPPPPPPSWPGGCESRADTLWRGMGGTVNEKIIWCGVTDSPPRHIVGKRSLFMFNS